MIQPSINHNAPDSPATTRRTTQPKTQWALALPEDEGELYWFPWMQQKWFQRCGHRALTAYLFCMLSACGGGVETTSERVMAKPLADECQPFLVEVEGEQRALPGVCQRGETAPAVVPTGDASRSVGLPHDGRLLGATKLATSDHINYVDSEVRGRHGGNFFGTSELVGLVERVADTVRARLRGSKLQVGELSAPQGGPLPGHNSHQNGRDVDIAFFYRDGHRQRVYPESFLQVDERGRTQRTRGAQRNHFDARANWILVETLLLDPIAQVQFIFVAEHIEEMLLREASAQGVPNELKRLAAWALREPEEHPHDNHFHVRIYCDPGDGSRCLDEGERQPRYGHRDRRPGSLRRAAERAQRLRLGSLRAGQRALREAPSREWRQEVPGREPRSLLWPVREDRYGRGFGMTRTDLPNVPHNGVDIGAVPNSIVRAAATGLVVFSGEFRSFGNCVFLVHKNGWVTTYAHNSRNTVVPGEIVREGDPIALIGSTGISRGPHLHFEFRDRSMLRDPEEVLNHVRTWNNGNRLPQRLVIPRDDDPDDGQAEDPAASPDRDASDENPQNNNPSIPIRVPMTDTGLPRETSYVCPQEQSYRAPRRCAGPGGASPG